MTSQTHSRPRFSACHIRQYLLVREERLRSAVKQEPDRQRAAVLADDAIAMLKRRFRHEESGCDLCRAQEGA